MLRGALGFGAHLQRRHALERHGPETAQAHARAFRVFAPRGDSSSVNGATGLDAFTVGWNTCQM